MSGTECGEEKSLPRSLVDFYDIYLVSTWRKLTHATEN